MRWNAVGWGSVGLDGVPWGWGVGVVLGRGMGLGKSEDRSSRVGWDGLGRGWC